MKKSFILAGLLVVGFASAQEGNVGINTSTPQATMDITANTADGDKVEGLMIPRITYAKMQAMKANLTEKHDGLMVYVTDYVEGGNSKDGVYRPSSYSPYFVYNGVAKEFLPFSPSGLTEVKNATGGGNSYVLANKARFHKTSQTPTELGQGAIDLSTDETSTLNAQGDYSFAAQGGTAQGQYSIAIGQETVASGDRSTAIGVRAKSYGVNSFAMHGGTAEGEYTTAIGQGAQASGYHSMALGWNAKASGEELAFALQGGTAEGRYSMAIGIQSKAIGESATAIGGATAEGAGSFAVAGRASDTSAIAIGGSAEGFASYAFGGTARGSRSISLNGSTIADGSVAIYGTTSGPDSFAAMEGVTNNFQEVAFGRNFQTDRDTEPHGDNTGVVLSPTRQIFSVGGAQTVYNDHGEKLNHNALIILRNAHTGIGILSDWQNPANSKPTEMLDVNGNIRVRGTVGITAGGACTNLGTITFSGDNFYGCKSTGWVLLNN